MTRENFHSLQIIIYFTIFCQRKNLNRIHIFILQFNTIQHCTIYNFIKIKFVSFFMLKMTFFFIFVCKNLNNSVDY